MRILAIINQKGGVGKSTTAHALGAGMQKQGKKVLYIDLDAQGNLSYTLGVKTEGYTALDLLSGNCTAAEALQKLKSGHVIGSSPGLSGADMLLSETGKEFRLKEALEPIQQQYDCIILDTPPALGILTVNALTAATVAVIPAQADIYSLQGIGQLHGTLSAIQKYTNPQLRVAGIVVTRYNPRTVLSRDITDMISDVARQLDTKVFAAKIRECIALKEAQARRTDIFSYAPKSNACIDYADLLDELGAKKGG